MSVNIILAGGDSSIFLFEALKREKRRGE